LLVFISACNIRRPPLPSEELPLLLPSEFSETLAGKSSPFVGQFSSHAAREIPQVYSLSSFSGFLVIGNTNLIPLYASFKLSVT